MFNVTKQYTNLELINSKWFIEKEGDKDVHYLKIGDDYYQASDGEAIKNIRMKQCPIFNERSIRTAVRQAYQNAMNTKKEWNKGQFVLSLGYTKLYLDLTTLDSNSGNLPEIITKKILNDETTLDHLLISEELV